MDEAHFFDALAANWDDNEVLSTPDKVNRILDLMNIKQNQEILDLGTGTGVLLPYLSERLGDNGKITAVDYSKGMLQRAIEKFSDLRPKPEFLKLDFENDNIPGEFDKIILYCVYPHLHSPIETLKWLMKVNLKEDGEIYIAFPCGPDYINSIHKERHSESDVLPSASVLVKYLRENDFNADLILEEENAYIVRVKKPNRTIE